MDWPATPGLPDTVKHGSRAGWVLSARALGVTEILLVREGRILEANRSSVFAVIGGLFPVGTGRAPARVRHATSD